MKKTVFLILPLLMLSCLSVQSDIHEKSMESFLVYCDEYKSDLIVENGFDAVTVKQVLKLIDNKEYSLFVQWVGTNLNKVILFNDKLSENERCIIYTYYLQSAGFTDKQISAKLEEYEQILEINKELK